MADGLRAPALPALRLALEQASDRFAALLRSGPDPGRRAVGTWTVGEVAAHAASSSASFLAVLRGGAPPEALDAVAANNAAFLAADPERDPEVLADRFADGERALLAQATLTPDDPMVEVFRGVRAPLSTLLAVELAEVLVHGRDIARASRLAWEIHRDEAAPAVQGLIPLLPHMLDTRAAAGFVARVELRVRGGQPLVLHFADSGLRVTAPDGGAVDCRLSADPAAYLLLSYGRIGPWKPLLQGSLVPGGRRPWLAARLPSMFRAP